MRRSRVLSFAPLIGLVLNGAIMLAVVVTPKLMERLGPGAEGYSVFLALDSLGAMLGGALIATLGDRLPTRLATSAGLLGCGLLYLLIARFPVYPALLGTSLLLGFCFMLLNAPLNSLMQSMVPATFLGRVFSVLSTVSSIGAPVTLLLVSPVLDRYPAGLFYTLAGTLMLAGCVAWMLVARSEPVPPDLHARAPGDPLDRSVLKAG